LNGLQAMLPIKQKLARGDLASMVLVNVPSPALVEHIGRLGFDAAFIDCEKGSATTERIEEMCRGARAAGIASVVRPWCPDPGLISRYLDLGADGIMLAGVDEVAAASALVDAVRYARWSDWAEKLVIAIIESPAGIDRLPELLAVEGVDVWFVGPNDLAHRMGFPGGASRPEVRAAIDRALRTISSAGRVAGTLASPGRNTELLAAGARFLLTRSNELMARGAAQFFDDIQAANAAASTRENQP
jgi:4-hydroxy-2-oxoheptanedioate aldolase